MAGAYPSHLLPCQICVRIQSVELDSNFLSKKLKLELVARERWSALAVAFELTEKLLSGE